MDRLGQEKPLRWRAIGHPMRNLLGKRYVWVSFIFCIWHFPDCIIQRFFYHKVVFLVLRHVSYTCIHRNWLIIKCFSPLFRTLWLASFPELFIRSLRNCPVMVQSSLWKCLCWRSIMRNSLTCSALLLMSRRDYNYLMIPETRCTFVQITI